MGSPVENDELGQNLPMYLRRVEKGEILEVLDHGTPIAVLAPPPQVPDALKRLAAEGKVSLPRLSLDQLGDPIDLSAEPLASEILANLREERIRPEDVGATDPPPTTRFRQMLGILGGMLLGAAVSNIFSMTTANDFSRLPVIVTVAASALGAFLIALELPPWTELGSRRGHDHLPTRRAGPKARG